MASRHTIKSWLARDIKNALDAQPVQPKVIKGERIARMTPKPTGRVIYTSKWS